MESQNGTGASISCDISQMRSPYLTKPNVLNEKDLEKDPFKLFKDWFEGACNCSQILEPNAMCLATATKDGIPSARYVLLKGFTKEGFVFYTNYNSRKGKELAENANVAVVFFWEPLKKQIRIEGTTSIISEDQSDKYFSSRPKGSQISASISKQSAVVPNRDVLEDERDRLTEKYANSEVPRPKHWGGYLISPRRIEFWQGQSDRLHDRFVFRRPEKNEKPDGKLTHAAEDGWVFERLCP